MYLRSSFNWGTRVKNKERTLRNLATERGGMCRCVYVGVTKEFSLYLKVNGYHSLYEKRQQRKVRDLLLEDTHGYCTVVTVEGLLYNRFQVSNLRENSDIRKWIILLKVWNKVYKKRKQSDPIFKELSCMSDNKKNTYSESFTVSHLI